MIGTPKPVTPAALTASSVTQYTVPASTTTVVKEILLFNSDSVARVVTVYAVPSGGSPAVANQILQRSLATLETYAMTFSTVLAVGDTIRALASVAAVVSFRASVVECV
jgi:hypothetical protein